MGGYRQWDVQKLVRYLNSGSTNEQMLRFCKIINQVIAVKKLHSKGILGMDSNIDQLLVNDPLNREDICEMYLQYENLRNSENLIIINSEPTWYRAGCKSSLIDHIVTNIPENIVNIKTTRNIMSDHSYIKCLVHTNEII